MEKYPFLMGRLFYDRRTGCARNHATKTKDRLWYASEITEEGVYADDKSKSLVTGKPGEVLILKCNFSEIYSNVLVTVTDVEAQ